MKKILSTLFAYIFWLSVLFGEIAGIVHSFKKHGKSDGLISVFLPPYSVYRGYEMFWHNDYADVNWEERYKSDLQIFIHLAGGSELENTPDNIRQIEKFYNSIHKYPKKNRDELQKRVDATMEYQFALLNDVERHCVEFVSNDKIEEYSVSQAIIEKENTLRGFGVPNEWFELNNYTMKAIVSQFEDTITEALIDHKFVDITHFKEKIKVLTKLAKTKSKEVYQRVFQKTYPLQQYL